MTKRERILLSKIRKYQLLLKATAKELKLASPNDLASIHQMMRRGMVQTVADIFELTAPLGSETMKMLPMNRSIIKEFRNTASHNYGSISNALAYACIVHCIDKHFMDAVANLASDSDGTGPAEPSVQ